jgi:carbonic anhydrase/acetyltransferase-like protein (isoleucine patch superfamily)
MLIEHRGKVPAVDPSAYIAPTAVLCGDVRLGPESRVLFGAVLSAEDGFSLFPGSRLGRDVEVRINGVVHVNSVLGDEELVPIGWVAAGNPARAIAPWDHEEIWRIQEALDFPRTVYGLPRSASARERMERQSEWFGAHRDDRIVDPR